MNGALSFSDVVVASTVLLGLGVLVALAARAPVHRQRAAELAVVATLVWLALAMVPLPRLGEGRPARSSIAAVVERVGPDIVQKQAAVAKEPPAKVADPVLRSRSATLLVVRVWAAGSLLVAAWVLAGVLLVMRLIARAGPPAPWLRELFEERRRARGVRRARLLVSPGGGRPLCVGVLRPIVVLPSGLTEPGRAPEIVRILDHELVHIGRGDPRGRLLFALAAPVLWLHPLFWWLRGRAALSAELIADDAAVGDGDRHMYAVGLLALAEELRAVPPAPMLTSGTFRNCTELERRIDMLANGKGGLATTCTPRRRAMQTVAVVALIGACAAVFGVRAPAASAAPAPVLDEVHVQAPQPEPRGAARESAADPAPEPVVDEVAVAEPVTGHDPVPAHALPQEDPGLAAVLELVERAHKLLTDLELAQSELAIIDGQVKTGVRHEAELVHARATVRGLERRLQVVRLLVAAEIKATQLEMTQVQKAMQAGDIEETQGQILLTRLGARLDVLRTVS